MSASVLDIEKFKEDFGDSVYGLMKMFEEKTLKPQLNSMAESLKIQDWAKIMSIVHTLEGSTGYICAPAFVQTCNKCQMFLKPYFTRITYDDKLPIDPNRPQYTVNENFGNKEKLELLAMIPQFIHEAQRLQTELSNQCGSPLNLQIFEVLRNENSRLIEIYSNLMSSQMNQSQRDLSIGASLRDVAKNASQTQIANEGSNTNHKKQSGLTKALSIQDNIIGSQQDHQPSPHDLPKTDNKCCEKCSLF